MFLGAHFNENGVEAANGSTLSTSELSLGSNLQNSLVISAGCHSGYAVDPDDAVPNVTGLPSWPEEFASAGATLIAGTGYQYGDSNYTAYSDQYYVDLAAQLKGGTVSVGAAMLQSQYQYLADLDGLNSLTEKSLLEVTLYGLPMLNVAREAARTPSRRRPASIRSPRPRPPSCTRPQCRQVLALRSVSTRLTSPCRLAPSRRAIRQPGRCRTTLTLTYDSGPSGVVANPGQAVLPVQTEDVAYSNNHVNQVLRGVGFWGGSYTDTDPSAVVTPLTGDPVTETYEPAATFASLTFYPETLSNTNYFPTLDSGANTDLGITPEQYISNTADTAVGTAIKRQYSDTQFALFYSDYFGSAALAAAPSISNVSVTADGSVVTVSATVLGNVSGVQQVWTTWTDPSFTPSGASSPEWQSVPLTRSPGDPTQYTATFSTGDTDILAGGDFIVQAANGVGEVSFDDNNGSYFTPIEVVDPLGDPTTVGLTISPTSLSYDEPATLTATVTPPPANGQGTVTFSQEYDGTTTSVCTNVQLSSSVPGTATCPLPSGLPVGPSTFTASYSGDSGIYLASSGPNPALTVTVGEAPTTTTLTVTPQGTSPDGPGTSVFGQPVTLSAHVVPTEYGIGPTGTVTFSDGSTQIGSPVTLSNGVASLTTSSLPVAEANLSATYSGDDNFSSSSPASATALDVMGAPTSTQLTMPTAGSSGPYGANVDLSATVSVTSPGAGAPTGTVTFYNGTTVIGTGTLSGGVATTSVASLPVSSNSLSATYVPSGDDFLASSSTKVGYTVNKAATTTTLTALTPSSAFGTSVSLSAQVAVTSPGSGTAASAPTGTVTFLDGTSVIATAGLPASGLVSVTVSGFQAGAHSLTASYGGDGNFSASPPSKAVTDTVTFTSTISGSSSGSLTVLSKQSVLITGSVSGSITVDSGGALEVENGKVSGSITATGAVGFTLCGATVSGAVSVSKSTGFVLIGGGTGCTKSTISGSVTLSGNTAGVEVATNTISGPVSVTNNSGTGPPQLGGLVTEVSSNTISGPVSVTNNSGTGPPQLGGLVTEVSSNTISGPLSCSGNTTGVTDNGSTNKASTKSGQCAML